MKRKKTIKNKRADTDLIFMCLIAFCLFLIVFSVFAPDLVVETGDLYYSWTIEKEYQLTSDLQTMFRGVIYLSLSGALISLLSLCYRAIVTINKVSFERIFSFIFLLFLSYLSSIFLIMVPDLALSGIDSGGLGFFFTLIFGSLIFFFIAGGLVGIYALALWISYWRSSRK